MFPLFFIKSIAKKFENVFLNVLRLAAYYGIVGKITLKKWGDYHIQNINFGGSSPSENIIKYSQLFKMMLK